MYLVELPERGEFDGGFDVAFKQNGQHHDADGRTAAQTRIDPDVVRRDIGYQDTFLFARALADQALAELEAFGDTAFNRVAGQEGHHSGVFRVFRHVEGAMLGADQWR